MSEILSYELVEKVYPNKPVNSEEFDKLFERANAVYGKDKITNYKNPNNPKEVTVEFQELLSSYYEETFGDMHLLSSLQYFKGIADKDIGNTIVLEFDNLTAYYSIKIGQIKSITDLLDAIYIGLDRYEYK